MQPSFSVHGSESGSGRFSGTLGVAANGRGGGGAGSGAEGRRSNLSFSTKPVHGRGPLPTRTASRPLTGAVAAASLFPQPAETIDEQCHEQTPQLPGLSANSMQDAAGGSVCRLSAQIARPVSGSTREVLPPSGFGSPRVAIVTESHGQLHTLLEVARCFSLPFVMLAIQLQGRCHYVFQT